MRGEEDGRRYWRPDLYMHELGRFLSVRRQRTSPEVVGLPAGRRRRTPGLRREEVAVLAGVSPTWYTRLEQGRTSAPSMDRLHRLAEVFGLSEDEWRYLYKLRRQSEMPEEDPPPPQVVERMTRQVNQSVDPYPMVLTNEYQDLLGWNPAAVEWYTDFSRLPAGRRNLLWWVLTAPEARERIVNWTENAACMVARFRVESASWLGEPRLTELVGALYEVSPIFRRLWDEHHVTTGSTRRYTARHPERGIVEMQAVVLQEAHGSLNITYFLPVDESAPTADERGWTAPMPRLVGTR